MPDVALATTGFRERLVVPWWWWAIGLALIGTFVVAVWAILSIGWAVGTLVIFGGLLTWGFLSWSQATVEVDQSVRAAGARIEPEWIGSVEYLDSAQFRQAVASSAGSGDHLVLRPWLSTGVRLWIDDPADPHPSWIIACRDTRGCATAVQQLLTAQGRYP